MLEELSRRDADYALKVPSHPWLGLKDVVQRCRRWRRVDTEISYFETTIPVDCGQMQLPLVVYRRRVNHKTRKNFQLDLFHPDDGHYEYSVVTSNKPIGAVALWHFMAGRGAQEKTLAELKDGFAFDSVPTNHYAANSAWQQLSVLAMNLLRRFQIETTAVARPRTRKRTFLYVLESIKTARFTWLNVAGRLVDHQRRADTPPERRHGRPQTLRGPRAGSRTRRLIYCRIRANSPAVRDGAVARLQDRFSPQWGGQDGPRVRLSPSGACTPR